MRPVALPTATSDHGCAFGLGIFDMLREFIVPAAQASRNVETIIDQLLEHVKSPT